MRSLLLWCFSFTTVGGCSVVALSSDHAQLTEQVTAAEVAFAKTMADRDHAAFASFIAEEAVFINGGKPVRGKPAIAADWKKFYVSSRAPFSWKPDLSRSAVRHARVFDRTGVERRKQGLREV